MAVEGGPLGLDGRRLIALAIGPMSAASEDEAAPGQRRVPWIRAGAPMQTVVRRLLPRVLFAVGLALVPASGALGFCPGDCNLDGGVTISELQRSVLVSLGRVRMNRCFALDLDNDGRGDIEELVAAVDAALAECEGR